MFNKGVEKCGMISEFEMNEQIEKEKIVKDIFVAFIGKGYLPYKALEEAFEASRRITEFVSRERALDVKEGESVTIPPVRAGMGHFR